MIRALLESAPDKAVSDLGAALGGSDGGPALAEVCALVRAEADDRATRDAVFGPLRPMFGPRADGVDQLTFPRPALGSLWRALKKTAPNDVALASTASANRADYETWPEVYDELCRAAAVGLRGGAAGDFAVAAGQLGDRATVLAGCLEVVAIARQAMLQLPEWLARMTEERAVAARLAFKDAVDVSEGDGVALFEILFANLDEPWQVLRLISAVMFRPVDNFLSGTELGIFGERLLNDIDRRLEMLKSFDAQGGVVAGRQIGGHLRVITAEIEAFEASLNLGRDGPWGARLNKQKAVLAKTAEGHLKQVDKAVVDCMPMAPVRYGGRTIRSAPRLDAPPDEALMRRAAAMLTLVEQVRGAAVKGGFNTLRLKVCEEAQHRLSSYAEDLLDTIHNGEGEEVINARLYLERVADLTGHVLDERAAQIVRRRAAAA